jgi:2-keto-4-pentenoate hydratase/2-oxohepta-3-ene-1,7-dioic acid hydratase in catechol pathway
MEIATRVASKRQRQHVFTGGEDPLMYKWFASTTQYCMRLCRFGNGRLGVVDGDAVRDVTAALDALPSFRYPLPRHDVLIEHLDTLRSRISDLAATTSALPLAGASLLSPIANPGKLIAAPVNYQKHLDEVRSNADLHHNNKIAVIQTAGLFLKATSSLVGAGEGVALRKLDRRTDHEVELAFVIGKRTSQVTRADALHYVAGYCIGLDITIRGPEERSLRKSVDSYSVLGPWMVTADEIQNPGTLGVSLSVNGAIRQQSSTADLILGVPELLEYASSFYTLYPGDVIFTGTPEGVGPIQPGDVITACIEKIGTMQVAVRADEKVGHPVAVNR